MNCKKVKNMNTQMRETFGVVVLPLQCNFGEVMWFLQELNI